MADTARNGISAVTAVRTALANLRHERFIPMGPLNCNLPSPPARPQAAAARHLRTFALGSIIAVARTAVL